MGKKVIVLVLALFILVSAQVFAKSTTEESKDNATVAASAADNVISVNAWPYLIALFNLGYERKILDTMSVRVRAEYEGIMVSDWNYYGFGGDVFFYPAGKALKGWYLGPRFDSYLFSYSKDSNSATAALYFVGGQAGYRWVNENGFSMALSLGAMKNVAFTIANNGNNSVSDPPFKNLMLPTFDFDLGYAF